jgi:hypothetical protein
MTSSTASALLAAAMLCGTAAAAAAQPAGRLLPATRDFRTPLADPFAARMGVALIATNLLATQGAERPPFHIPDPEDASHDVVAAVALGMVFPVYRLSEWDGGALSLVAEGKVFSRFRIEYESRDDMGQDWFVGGGLEARGRRWSARGVIVHRSSHLGDEFMLETGAERIEFGAEQLDVLAARELPYGLRVYGGGSYVFRSYLNWEPRLRELDLADRGGVQLGADGQWRPWSDPRWAAWLGLDVQAVERTDWDPGVSIAAGIGVDTGRSMRLLLRYYRGPSTMGEFFLTKERYYGVEVLLEGW